jgi:hypothetical protein
VAESREYRVIWSPRGSNAEFQLGRVENNELEAERHGKGAEACRLRVEGCRLRIESRRVGPWVDWPDPTGEDDTDA